MPRRRRRLTPEDQELLAIHASEQDLLRRHKEYSDLPRKLAAEMRERDSTLPPLAEIEIRRNQRAHEEMVSRGEAKNILRDQRRSLALCFLLLTATGSLIWWGLQLMAG